MKAYESRNVVAVVKLAFLICKVSEAFEYSAVGKRLVVERNYANSFRAQKCVKVYTQRYAPELLRLCERILNILFKSGNPLSL